MNENAKKALLVVVTLAAVVVAVFGAMRLFGEEKMEVQNTIATPPGHKSEKQQALEAQAAGGGDKGGGKDRDLGGDLGGR